MKRLVGSLVFVVILTLVAPAIAHDRPQEYDLYANRDGRAFSFERSFPSLAACNAAAKSMYDSKRVRGVGCKPTPTPPAAADPKPDPNEKKKASADDRKARAPERPR